MAVFWGFVLLLAILALFLLVSGIWPTIFGAPWVPTRRKQVDSLLALAEVTSEDIVYDLGCGDGRILFAAARKYGARAVGIEIEPFKYLWCQLLISLLGLRKQVTVRLGNLFDADIRDATVVVVYLLKETNQRLSTKLKRELTPGTRVISNIFTFPEQEPIKEKDQLLLYIVDGGET